jgi:hypothetical protein
MGMQHCAHCNSTQTQAGLDTWHCLRCNGLTDMEGRPLPGEPVFEGGFNPSDLRPT